MPGERAIRVQVLAMHECAPIVPVGMIDLLRKSSELAATVPARRPRPRIELALVSAGERRTVTAANGLVLTCDATLRTAGRADVVVVPVLDPSASGSRRRSGRSSAATRSRRSRRGWATATRWRSAGCSCASPD